FPNVYGIDMPTRSELIATGRSDEEICREIGADRVIYQDLESLKKSVRQVNPGVCNFESSCFDGYYITGDVTANYLASIESQRDGKKAQESESTSTQLDLNLVSAEER
ncbi:MAG: amidophosphoribosyltransferase, partial [Burkholderiales bacterium]